MVMFNHAWCKAVIHALHCRKSFDSYKIFLSGTGSPGRSHVIKLIHRDVIQFFELTLKPEPDEPLVLLTTPMGLAAFQIGGTTLHATFMLHSKDKQMTCWDKRSTMLIKLLKIILLIIDELSTVGTKVFSHVNRGLCRIKCSHKNDLGCVGILARVICSNLLMLVCFLCICGTMTYTYWTSWLHCHGKILN